MIKFIDFADTNAKYNCKNNSNRDYCQMPQATIDYLIKKLDEINTNVHQIKVDLAVQQEQIKGLLEDRKLAKGKIMGLIAAITTVISAIGGWLAIKLGVKL